jgi:tripartite-type tricarboxylate transporter receptor subunit TctC
MFWRTATAVVVLLCVQLPLAEAEDWPSRPVRILVGFGPGGGTDVVARILAEKLSGALGRQFLVENRPGAGGTIAGGIVAKAPNDGYTALAISTGHTVSAVMVKEIPYDPVKSFAPVGILASSAYVVVVSQSSPATDLDSLVAQVNKGSGKAKFSTVGVGSTQHLIAEDLRQRTGLSARHVAYGTTGEVVAALLRGDVVFGLDLYHAVRGQAGFGDLRLIAVTTAYRWPTAPAVPTLAESGLPGVAYGGWYGLVFPAGTSQRIIERLHKTLQQVLADDDVKDKLEAVGAIATLTSPTQLAELIEWDIKNFREVARKAGLESGADGRTSPGAGGLSPGVPAASTEPSK